ncbi:MAG: NusA N-terminal domain-containing protein, partial [Bacteroidota bacterium]
MDTSTLIESFADFAKQKNIDRPTMIRILEDVFRNMIKKKYVQDDNFDIIVNADKGDLEIWRFREIVDDESEDIWDHDKISLTEARKIEPDFEVGEDVSEEVKLIDLGRRAILALRQNLISKIHEHDNTNLYKQFKDIIGEIYTAEVHHV